MQQALPERPQRSGNPGGRSPQTPRQTEEKIQHPHCGSQERRDVERYETDERQTREDER